MNKVFCSLVPAANTISTVCPEEYFYFLRVSGGEADP